MTDDGGRSLLCSVRIGRGIGLVHGDTVMLVDEANGRFAERLWELLVAEEPAEVLLEELSAHGIRSLGDFALAHAEDSGVRVVVRGGAVAVAVTGDGAVRRVSGAGVHTWVEEILQDVEQLSLGLAEPPAIVSPFRISSGIVPADAVVLGVSQSQPGLDGLDLAWASEFEAPRITPPESNEPVDAPPDLLPGVPAEAPVDDATEALRSPMPSSLDVVVADDGSVDVEATRHDYDPEPSAPADPVGGKRFDFDALYGHTVARPVHGAARLDSSDNANGSPEVVVSDDAEIHEGPSGVADQPLDTLGPPGDGALIAGVPGSSGEVDPTGDHDGHTVSISKLVGLAAPSGPPSAALGRPVLASLCVGGHANPPTAFECATCGSPLSSPPIHVPRPSLGHLVFGSGERVELDRPAVIGRNPKIEGRVGSELPRVVKLAGGTALSRSHIAVHLEGWQVLVEDLGSANGTVMTLPGRDPQRLRAGEPMIIVPGTVIDLGGETEARFEASPVVGG